MRNQAIVAQATTMANATIHRPFSILNLLHFCATPALFASVIIIFPEFVFSQTSARDSLQQALHQHVQDDTARVNILNALSNECKWIDFPESQRYAEQALKISRALHFEKGTAVADYRMAHCYWALGDNDLAIERGLEAVEIAERNHFESALGESYTILARAYIDQAGFDKAKAYLAPAEKIAVETRNGDLLSRVYNLSGVLLLVEGRNDSALRLYAKTLDVIRKHPSSRSLLSVIKLNIGECYLGLQKPDLALESFKEALSISKVEATRNTYAEAIATSKIGLVLVSKNNLSEAERYLVEGLRLSRLSGSKRTLRYPYAGLLELKTKQGKSAEALAYYRKYYDVNDSIMNVFKMRQIVELENKHQLELLAREKKIQQLRANILVGALVLVAILSVAVYYFLLFRQKKNLAILNLQIDNLTGQQQELSRKYKGLLVSKVDKPVESMDQRLLKKAIEVVEKKLSDPLFGVDQLAREIGMSRTNLHRKLKAITGFGPGDLIRNIRLRNAAALLLHQADSVSQIGFQVGFEDHSYFSKSFKKQFGVAPSEYLQFIKQSEN